MKGLKRRMIAGQAIPKFDFFIQWHLTKRCNLRCRHCYQARPQRDSEELRPAQVRGELDGAAAMVRSWRKEYGVAIDPSVHFTGGEPLLYRGLWKIAAYARKLGFAIALLTNGTLVTRHSARKARDLGLFDIQVSLEGPRAIHDGIRGSGSFDLARRGIALLAGAGCRVSVNATLSRLNYRSIPETIEAARDAGANAIYFSRLVPCGSGQSISGALLSAEELRCAYLEIKSRGEAGGGFAVGCGDPLFQVLGGPDGSDGGLTLAGCSAGFSGVTIDSAGKVMPCRRIGIIAGDLRKDSLREIWASSPVLEKLRNRESYGGKCGRCSYWPVCRGCRAVAYHHSMSLRAGDLFADDPQCWF